LRDTVEGRQQKDLLSNRGILYLYSDYVIRIMDSQNLNFSADVVWLKNGAVVGFAEKMPSRSMAATSVVSPEIINQVLVLKAGFVAQNGIKVGDKLILSTGTGQ